MPPTSPEHRLVCLRQAGLLPARLSQGVDKSLVDVFLCRLYGMYIPMLAGRMAVASTMTGSARSSRVRCTPGDAPTPSFVAACHAFYRRPRSACGLACRPVAPVERACAHNLVC